MELPGTAAWAFSSPKIDIDIDRDRVSNRKACRDGRLFSLTSILRNSSSLTLSSGYQF
jgi:hypothetical protein